MNPDDVIYPKTLAEIAEAIEVLYREWRPLIERMIGSLNKVADELLIQESLVGLLVAQSPADVQEAAAKIRSAREMGGDDDAPHPAQVLLAQDAELKELSAGFVDLYNKAGRLPPALVSIISAGFSQVADEVGLDSAARRRLQEALSRAGDDVSGMLNL